MIDLPKIDQTKLDNYHFNGDRMLGHNKTYNVIVSCRELGKTTWFWLYAYRNLLKGYKTIMFKFIQADITESWIDDQANVLNKFLETPIQFYYNRGSIKSGCVDVRIGLPNVEFKNINTQTEFFVRIIAISLPIRRIKGMIIPHLRVIGFDEFIVDTRRGEKYPTDVAFKFKEAFNSFDRESETGLRCFFLGNPYSLFNPFFVDWKVPTKELYPGNVWYDETHYVECGKMSEELKQHILNRNPLYKFDDSYKAYAFDGRSINDEQIRIETQQPRKYKLRYVFYIEHQYMYIYENYDPSPNCDWFWIDCRNTLDIDDRQAICFNYNDLIQNTKLISRQDKDCFNFLLSMFRVRRVQFSNLSASYFFEQIFTTLCK